tara:strand:+ start:619 stop:1500 length:882 start_codon:yes stop_codon:yes gene_type:complete
MAVTDIQATVLANTGKTPTANSVEDAQRYVAASIPKDLLTWAQNATSPSTDGSAISLTSTDSIIDVQRNGYSCEEIPLSESIFALSSSSLKKATSTHPVWYHKQGAVHFAPVTDGSNAGYVFYVDHSKIDDDSDLRNAVINYASSREFTALAISTTFPMLSWGKETPPTFTPPTLQQPDWSDVENWITTEEDSEMLNSRVSAIQSQIGEYTAKLQAAQAEFGSELQDYQARINETVQLNQGQISEWQAENGVKLSHYLQLSAQHYNWAMSEIKTYIENNTRTLDKVVELQRGK